MAMRRDREVEFSQPVRQIAFMLAALAAVGGIGWFLYAPIATVFQANVYLNGLILAVFVIGVVACFLSVAQLSASVSWIEGFAADRAGHEFAEPPRLMASLSALLRDSRSRLALSATSTRSILDSVATRLDETRDITRYIGNLLIFLGLLGTFWGLSNTVPAVVDTIRSLAPEGGEGGGLVFDRLMAGLEDQLGGMGTAFASSLLGLAGSLVIGLLELFVGHAQNRFFRELEEWLSSITRVSAADGGDQSLAATLIEQNAAQIDSLGELLIKSEGKREAFEARLAELTDSVSRLAGALAAAEPARDAERQTAALERIAMLLERRPADPEDGFADDADVRARLRSIDRQLLRLLDEVASGRQDAVADLRGDLHALTRAVAGLRGS
ncbi:MAG: biopolymer transporter ExbB [Rubrimonas sp.]